MFYEQDTERALRFGDVLTGFVTTTPNMKDPFLSTLSESYKIDVDLPKYSVVISPCCSIRDGIISLTPLIKVYGTFFDNPYLAGDLTRINRGMEPKQTVSPHKWNQFPPEVKQKYLEEGKGYAFFSLFVYEKNDLFTKYTIHRKKGGDIETNYYMIDFKNTYRLNCERIKTPENSPLESKNLQLSIQTRSELRDKISSYYARIPREEKVLID